MSPAPQHADGGFDEAWAAPGEPRAHYAALLDEFASVDVSMLRAALGFAMSEQGVTFGDHRFEVCPVPRLLTADEAARLAAGLEQRVRALNAFVADCYGERRIVAAGRVPEWIIDSSEGYEPALAGRWPGGAPAIGVAGLDDEHVVKPRVGQGGGGVVVCAHATARDVRSCLAAVRERPERVRRQPLVSLSTVPTVVGDDLVPRHVDLRPFIFSAPTWTRVIPSGLTRVALGEGALVVNSSQNGGGKVTWALR